MEGMSIWILALFVVLATTLAGWRQGAIRAAFATVGILAATFLAAPLGHLLRPLLHFLGVKNPLLAWSLAPLIGFILVSIVFVIVAQTVHKRVDHFYRYTAGDLRRALWERLNARVGICLGVLNGSMYFVLVSFVVFNLAYLTSQISTAAQQPLLVRVANQLGTDLEGVGLSRTATAVGTLPQQYYQLSDMAGFLMQNPQTGPRFVQYPALTSLWERPEMQMLVNDSALTNALVAQVTLGDLFSDKIVTDFLADKDQTKLVMGILEPNMDDLMAYLQTGKSEKYNQKIIGHWEYNPSVTLAWMRQSMPKTSASQMRALRAFIFQAYTNTRILVTGDNQVFLKGLPKVKVSGKQAPTIDHTDWKGDWAVNGSNYDLHLSSGGEDKFMTATAEDLRLVIKDGKNLMIFDRAY
jgi:uncharacterized membrane protein required for colicin V production